MATINAHFDGKVIVPDEPLNLSPNHASQQKAIGERTRTRT